MRTVLICGGRNFVDKEWIFENLDRMHKTNPINLVIQGEARGVDRLAKEWAGERGIVCLGYPADWSGYGRKAGPVRNQQMLDEGNPELVIAFPGGSGTADMVTRARRMKIKVIVIGVRS